MKTRKLVVASLLIPILYVGIYGGCRLSGEIVRYQNKGQSRGPEIVAPHDPWADIGVKLAKESEVPLLGVFTSINAAKPQVLNFAFWPLRKLENTLRRSGEE